VPLENLYYLFYYCKSLSFIVDVDIIIKLTMTSGWGCKFAFEFSFFSLDQNAEVKQKLGASEKEREVCSWQITSYRLVY